jgi:hypothetical protein
MEYQRGIYKAEIFPGVTEYRAYTHTGRCATDSRMPTDLATPQTDECFDAWLDLLDPEGVGMPTVTVSASASSPPVSDALAA